MPAQLVALDYGPSILLDKPILLLGRHPECDLQIDSRKISRRHCCIAQVSDYLVVRDLGSTNGIRINGIRIVEGKLSDGDELTIGNHRYKVTWDEVASPVVPPSSAQSLSPPDRGVKAERRSPKRTARDPSPVEDIEDEMLESCDEPVALDESDQEGLPLALPAQPPAPEPPLPKKDSPLYLPDELRLMPHHSDPFRKGSPLASPSGSHPPA